MCSNSRVTQVHYREAGTWVQSNEDRTQVWRRESGTQVQRRGAGDRCSTEKLGHRCSTDLQVKLNSVWQFEGATRSQVICFTLCLCLPVRVFLKEIDTGIGGAGTADGSQCRRTSSSQQWSLINQQVEGDKFVCSFLTA